MVVTLVSIRFDEWRSDLQNTQVSVMN